MSLLLKFKFFTLFNPANAPEMSSTAPEIRLAPKVRDSKVDRPPNASSSMISISFEARFNLFREVARRKCWR